MFFHRSPKMFPDIVSPKRTNDGGPRTKNTSTMCQINIHRVILLHKGLSNYPPPRKNISVKSRLQRSRSWLSARDKLQIYWCWPSLYADSLILRTMLFGKTNNRPFIITREINSRTRYNVFRFIFGIVLWL